MTMLYCIITYNPYENDTFNFIKTNYKLIREHDMDILIIDNSTSHYSTRLLKNLKQAMIYKTSINIHYPGSLYLILKFLSFNSKYENIIIANDDILLNKKFTEFIDTARKIDYALINGLLMQPNGKIYSLGGAITQSGYSIGICYSSTRDKCNTDTAFPVSYPDGALFLIKREAIKTIINDHSINILKLLYPYIDDTILGTIAWKNNLKVGAQPIQIATHYVSLSYGKADIIVTKPKRSYLLGVVRGFQLSSFKNTNNIIYLFRDILRNIYNTKSYLNGFIKGIKIPRFKCTRIKMPIAKDNLYTIMGIVKPGDLTFQELDVCL